MAKSRWNRLADAEFTSMPKSWQDDWKDLRKIVSKRK